MTFSSRTLLRVFIAAFFIAAIGGGLAYVVHQPKIGIDDANITQTYAKNIANGFGYVYNKGGEHVEGSTSLLWTVLNVFFFKFSDSPELLITIFCFFLTVLTIAELLLFLKSCSHLLRFNFRNSTFIFGFLLLANPSFFAWSIWALMDTTLWIFCFTTILCRSISLILGANSSNKTHFPASATIICGVLVIFPLVRPEGVAISLGLAGLLILYAYSNRLRDFQRYLLITLASIISIFVVITLFRIQYFGFPFPNTFYAKVSTSYLHQVVMGVKYFIRYLINPTFLFVLIFAFATPIVLYIRSTFTSKSLRWMLILFTSAVFGVFIIYVVLGGDHFGSARQFQVLTPLLVVFATLSILMVSDLLLRQMYLRDGSLGSFISLSIITFVFFASTLPNVVMYLHDGGGISHEFRIAESDRKLGKILNQLPGAPTLGVVSAGGISRTYEGHIYDMMGLNWVEMAHANRKHNTQALKNHEAFSKEVFFGKMPAIVTPSFGACRELSATEFSEAVLPDLFNDERFVKNYKTACYQGTVFYVKREWFEKLSKYISAPR